MSGTLCAGAVDELGNPIAEMNTGAIRCVLQESLMLSFPILGRLFPAEKSYVSSFEGVWCFDGAPSGQEFTKHQEIALYLGKSLYFCKVVSLLNHDYD